MDIRTLKGEEDDFLVGDPSYEKSKPKEEKLFQRAVRKEPSSRPEAKNYVWSLGKKVATIVGIVAAVLLSVCFGFSSNERKLPDGMALKNLTEFTGDFAQKNKGQKFSKVLFPDRILSASEKVKAKGCIFSKGIESCQVELIDSIVHDGIIVNRYTENDKMNNLTLSNCKVYYGAEFNRDGLIKDSDIEGYVTTLGSITMEKTTVKGSLQFSKKSTFKDTTVETLIIWEGEGVSMEGCTIEGNVVILRPKDGEYTIADSTIKGDLVIETEDAPITVTLKNVKIKGKTVPSGLVTIKKEEAKKSES